MLLILNKGLMCQSKPADQQLQVYGRTTLSQALQRMWCPVCTCV